MIPVLLTWYAHFAIGSKIFENRLYQASPEYQEIIAQGETARLSNFPLMLRDTFRFFARENRGVPKLDVCKPGENGSYPMSWVIGAKSINYRWTKHPDGSVSYLYLLFNPVVLLLSIGALVLSVVVVGGHLAYGLRIENARLFAIVAAMSAMYFSYMLVMLRLDRVMYLYHYFPPYVFMLIAGVALLCCSFGERLRAGDRVLWTALLLLAVNVIVAYDFFSPLSYYEPLSLREFNSRIWFSPWRLEPIS
jgi:dolichyl-phosphate-mannose--protein O-mannosyl transferase